jgi:hypothetical protein
MSGTVTNLPGEITDLYGQIVGADPSSDDPTDWPSWIGQGEETVPEL